MKNLMLLFAILIAASAAAQTSIIDTKHNLSVSGPGDVRALTEERVCIFCHTPHNASSAAPLWNRRDSNATYIPYDSPTLRAKPGQPTGASKLCLSCHDGTIAMGDLLSEQMPIAMTSGGNMPAGSGLIGTDLRDDHPISFAYTESMNQSGGELSPPGMWDPRVKLDAAGMMQCTTCHDPHDNAFGQFLVMQNAQATLCRQCHNPFGYDATPHATSGAQWNGAGLDPWPHTEFNDVQSNSCMNCHTSHHAGKAESLLTYQKEEDTCFACHSGNVASDLRSVFQKSFRHPVERSEGVHEANEGIVNSLDHVECVDCHNPHRAANTPAEAPFVMGMLQGVSGVNALGVSIDEVSFEYEVCFKCHAQETFTSLNAVRRQIDTTNVMREFSPSSPSYHPVEVAGVSADVPSLISPLTPASVIYCSDCHGNETASPKGPHGSSNEFMLVRQYQTGDNITESQNAYALCYGCHSRSSILSNESFPGHQLHVVDERTSCSTCHDGHGIDFTRGNSVANARLINFDTTIVQPDPVTGRLEFEFFGASAGQCYLTCHGKAHSPLGYPN